jgi:hypothetical protein
MTGLSIPGNLWEIIEAGADHSAIRAMEALRSSGASYCVVTDASGPLSLVTAEDLAALPADRPAALADLAAQLPSLVSVRDKPEMLSAAEITGLATLISGRNVRGVLVDDGVRPVGALSRDSVAGALALDDLRVFGRRLGSPRVPCLEFVCRKCVPPTYRLPRSAGTEAPVCRRSYFHGPMELLDGEEWS